MRPQSDTLVGWLVLRAPPQCNDPNAMHRVSPPTPQEEECVENLFDALAAALLVPDNQQRFRQGVV